MQHENLDRTVNAGAGNPRTFGWVMSAALAAFAMTPRWHGGEWRLCALAAAAVVGGLALFRPDALSGPSRLWTRIGLVMGYIVSPLALAVVFYGVITPAALLFRLFGVRLLHKHADPSATSYWQRRTSPTPDRESLRNQF